MKEGFARSNNRETEGKKDYHSLPNPVEPIVGPLADDPTPDDAQPEHQDVER